MSINTFRRKVGDVQARQFTAVHDMQALRASEAGHR